MNRLECLGKSSTGLQNQLGVKVTSAHADAHKPSDKVGKKRDTGKPRKLPPARVLPASLQISCQETQRSGFPHGDVLNTDDCPPKEPIIHSSTPRVEEKGHLTAVLDEELKMKDMRKAQPLDTTVTGGKTHAPPAVEPLPTHEGNGEEEQTEEEDVEDEDIRAPLELIMEFLRAVMDRDFQLASKLCQMILIYEPGNPEASEFLPLIQKKLLEDQEAEQSTDEDDQEDKEDEEDDDDDSESDEESSQSSSCSSSSPTDDDEEEKQVNRHKPCPPSHICT